MNNRLTLLGILILAAGCDGGPGMTLGDAQLRITDGDAQVHPAAQADSLDEPVSAQIFRTPEGGITFRLVTPAYAQTSVVGVPNEQVCAEPVGDIPLEPWNRCDITDPNGLAQFFFEPGTRAGEACAEIRAVVDGEKVITDTVCALVEPGEFVKSAFSGFASAQSDIRLGAEVYTPGYFYDTYGNLIPAEFSVEGPFVVTAEGIDIAPGTEYGATGTFFAHRADDGTLLESVNVTVVEGAVTRDEVFSWTLNFN